MCLYGFWYVIVFLHAMIVSRFRSNNRRFFEREGVVGAYVTGVAKRKNTTGIGRYQAA